MEYLWMEYRVRKIPFFFFLFLEGKKTGKSQYRGHHRLVADTQMYPERVCHSPPPLFLLLLLLQILVLA